MAKTLLEGLILEELLTPLNAIVSEANEIKSNLPRPKIRASYIKFQNKKAEF